MKYFLIILAFTAFACKPKKENQRNKVKITKYEDGLVRTEDNNTIVVTDEDCGDVTVNREILSDDKDIIILSDGDITIDKPITTNDGDVVIKSNGDVVLGSPITTGSSASLTNNAVEKSPCAGKVSE